MIAICSRFGVLRWLLIVPVDSLFKAVGQLMGCVQGREVGARAPRLLWFILLAICSRFCSPKEVNRIFFFFFFFFVQCEHYNSQTYIKIRQRKVSFIHLETVELVGFLWGEIKLKRSGVFPPVLQLFNLNSYSSMGLTTHSPGSFSHAWNFTIGECFPFFQPFCSLLYSKAYCLFN